MRLLSNTSLPTSSCESFRLLANGISRNALAESEREAAETLKAARLPQQDGEEVLFEFERLDSTAGVHLLECDVPSPITLDDHRAPPSHAASSASSLKSVTPATNPVIAVAA
jgi:hypothetical protein